MPAEGDKITVVLAGGVFGRDICGATLVVPSQLVHGEVDGSYFELAIAGRYSTMQQTQPAGCFFFRAACTMCFLREADEDHVWIRGHVTEQEPDGAALLAAWHMGDERVVGLALGAS